MRLSFRTGALRGQAKGDGCFLRQAHLNTSEIKSKALHQGRRGVAWAEAPIYYTPRTYVLFPRPPVCPSISQENSRSTTRNRNTEQQPLEVGKDRARVRPRFLHTVRSGSSSSWPVGGQVCWWNRSRKPSHISSIRCQNYRPRSLIISPHA